jgi:hypothetical protein
LLINENEQYSYEDVQVVISDVASLYPNLIINEECIRYPAHTKGIETKDERMLAKKQ